VTPLLLGLVQAGVLHSDGDLIGQRRQQAGQLLGEGVGLGDLDVQDAHRRRPHSQRDGRRGSLVG
jgi:hypothetical protein